MANKRMFSIDVVDTDKFLDMPVSTQALYFHFGICVVSDVRMCSSGRHIRPRRMFTRSSAG